MDFGLVERASPSANKWTAAVFLIQPAVRMNNAVGAPFRGESDRAKRKKKKKKNTQNASSLVY